MRPICYLIDNHDSFVYNLYRYLDEIITDKVRIVQNDKIDLEELKDASMIVLSPGPDLPENAGLTKEVIRTYHRSIPILGICLGHQAIYEVFGGELKRLDKVCHGIISHVQIEKTDDVLFKGISVPFEAGRYHSWVADENYLPEDILISSRDEAGIIMSISHARHPVFGVQFHPESIMTPDGRKLIGNFVKFAQTWKKNHHAEI